MRVIAPAPVVASIFVAVLLPLLASPPPARAQETVTAAVTDGLASHFEEVSGYILTGARQIPESKYSYKPTPEVRDLAGIFNHVAGAEASLCAAASGRAMPASVRKPATGKTAIVSKLADARSFCLDVFQAAADMDLSAHVISGGTEQTVANVLVGNVAHTNLHYGNLVTYMREIGMVPPSTQAENARK